MSNSNSNVEEVDERVLVPCEFCEQMVDFYNYVSHTQQCLYRTQPIPIPNAINPVAQNTVLVIHDAEDGEYYRILLDDAIAAFTNHMQIIEQPMFQVDSFSLNTPDQNETTRISNTHDDSSASQTNDDSDEEYTPMVNTAHRSILMIPRIVNTGAAPQEITDMNDYEFNLLLSERVGKVCTGFKTEEEINRVLKSVSVEPADEDLCAVCREELQNTYNENSKNVVQTICGHSYCKGCIDMWLHTSKKCPICQADLEDLYKKFEIEDKIKTT